jgi:hypothetical protein
MHKISPVVISFYTLQTPYQQEVLHLIRSCEKWEIEARIEGMPSFGSWEKNCAYKPQFISQKLKQLNRPILWVDADAIFHNLPKWEDFVGCDLSLRINSSLAETHGSRVLSGTLFVNNTPEAKILIEEWNEECQKGLHIASRLREAFGEGSYFWDQIALKEALFKNKEVKVKGMPLSYCKIFDLDQTTEIIIEHLQASRRFKQEIR